MALPPLPAGFVLDEDEEEEVGTMAAPGNPPAAPAPPLPEGFVLDEEPGLTGSVTDTSPEEEIDVIGYDAAGAAPHEMPGNLESSWSGLRSGALMGFDDEIEGLGGALGGGIGWLAGKDTGLIDGYTQARDRARARKDEHWEGNALAYGLGFLPGAVMSAPLTMFRGAQAATLPGRLGQAARGGAEAGALSGFGNAQGDFGDQAMSTAGGTLMGIPAGVLSYPVAAGLGNLIGRVSSRFGPRAGQETSGLDMLEWRAPQDANAMATRLDEFETAGVPARLIDVIDESGRGVVRDSASKMTPAREEVARHADDVYTSAQDRVAEQAQRHISNAPDTARQLERQIRGDRVLGGDDEAGVLMGEMMEPLRARPIAIDDDMKMVLSTREGQAALRAAEGLMTDPAEREAARAMLSAARSHARGPIDPEQVWRNEVDEWDELPEVIKAAYRAQRPDVVEQADPFQGVTMTLDMADKFARAMRGRAAKTPGLERVSRDFANAVRGSARQQVPEYEEALAQYAASQGVADAAGGTGRFENSDFLRARPDNFEAQVGRASAEPGAINVNDNPTISERDAMRMRARDDIVDVATGNGGQNAMSVARTVSRGSGQARRNEALLGEEGARALEDSMGREVQRVDNTRFVDSRQGSKTASANRDAVVDGFIDAIPNVATGGKWGIAREAARWLRKGGIRDIDAERLARLSISERPDDVRAAIDYLSSRGMERSRADRFVHAIAEHVAARPATAAPDQPNTPPNSVRALRR